MILLVDGYNVINRVPELRPSLDGGLQNARNRLALQVSTWSHGYPGVECVIVFDGDIEHSGGRGERVAGVRCIYSLTAHGADDEIIRFVRDYKGRKSDITVVSDDNKVGNNCRAHGAVVRPSGFIMGAKGASPPRGRAGKPADAGKGIDRKAAAEIDKELRKKFGLS
jgi:predicted RNA-binding protein with PIN domain